MAAVEMEGGKYALLRAPALRREALERGLDSTGKKRDLVLRLVAADKRQAATMTNAVSNANGRSTASAGRLAEAVVRALKTPQPAAGAAAATDPAALAQPVLPSSHDVADVEVDVDESPRDDGENDNAAPVDADPYGEVVPAVSEDPYAVLSEDPYGGLAEDPSDDNTDADTCFESVNVAMANGEKTCNEEEVLDVLGVKGELSAGIATEAQNGGAELPTPALTTAEGAHELKADAPIATHEEPSTLAMRGDGSTSSIWNVATSNSCEIIDIDNDSGTEECSTLAPQRLAASPAPAAAPASPTAPMAPTMAQPQLQRRLRLRQLLQDATAGTIELPYPQLLEKLHVAIASSKAGDAPEMQVPAAPEMLEAAEAAPNMPLDVGDVENNKAAEVAPDISEDASVVDAQKASEDAPVMGDVEVHKSVAATPDVSTNTRIAELQEEVDVTLKGTDQIDSIYRKPNMPLALLRAYSNQARWVGLRGGFVIFEEDAIQYPASTPTPMRTAPGGDQRFDLVSLWLLVALRRRYEEAATPALLGKLEATRIPEAYVAEVLSYLSGQSDRCNLLAMEPDGNITETLPVPLTWRRRFLVGSASPLGLRCGFIDVCGGANQSTAAAPSEMPACRVINNAHVAHAEEDGEKGDTDVATSKASDATEAEDVQTKAAEAAAASKIAVDADGDLCRLEKEEALLTQLLEDCGQKLMACVRDLAAAEARCRRLRGDGNTSVAQDDGDNPSAAKRLKLCGWA